MCGYSCSHCGRCKGAMNVKTSTCYKCGNENKYGEKFCNACGYPLPLPPGKAKN